MSPPRRACRDLTLGTRGVSEGTAVAVLVGFTLLVTASIGVGVLLFEEEPEGPDLEFSYDYLDDASTLLITIDAGEDLPSENLLVSGPDNNVTWGGLAGYEDNRTVGTGDAVQVGRTNAYGSPVLENDRIDILYERSAGNSTVVGSWPEG